MFECSQDSVEIEAVEPTIIGENNKLQITCFKHVVLPVEDQIRARTFSKVSCLQTIKAHEAVPQSVHSCPPPLFAPL
jgi:hypothetical protein